jgi:hypothetical protein
MAANPYSEWRELHGSAQLYGGVPVDSLCGNHHS